jgi:hypothetical protein
MIVDADYTPKPYEEWTVQDWPETYQNPSYPNIFAPGIALHHLILFQNLEKVKMVQKFFLHHHEQECLRELRLN